MKKGKMSPLWFKSEELMKLKNDFDLKGIKYGTENNTFYFHLQTAIFTSAAWAAVIVLIAVLS